MFNFLFVPKRSFPYWFLSVICLWAYITLSTSSVSANPIMDVSYREMWDVKPTPIENQIKAKPTLNKESEPLRTVSMKRSFKDDNKQKQYNQEDVSYEIAPVYVRPSLEYQASPSRSWSDEVVVTAKRIPTFSSHSAENIKVITEKDIEKLPARNLGEVLKYVPGVDVLSTSEFGQASSVSINGSKSRQVLIMVDGIPFNTQLSGQANPTRIPIGHIKQIEVIKGASSSAWGSSIGGVINVITKDVGDSHIPEGQFTTSYGEFASTTNSLDLSGKVGELGYYLSGSFLKTDGPFSETDVEETKSFLKLAHPLADAAKLTASFGYSGANVRYGVTRSNRINSTPYISRYGQLVLDVDKPTFDFQAAYKYNDQDITTDIFNASTGALVSATVSHNFLQGVGLNGSMEINETDTFVLGGDFDWQTLKSNNFLTESKSIGTQAAYSNYTRSTDRWDVIPGIRYDRNEHFGEQFSPSFGVVYHFLNSSETLLRAKASQAFNAPPLLWIFNDDPTLFVGPSPDLDAESANVYELGLESDISSRVHMNLSLYRMDVKDAIGLVFQGGAFVQRNFRKFRRQGAELQLQYDITKDLSLVTSGAFNDVENRETGQMVRDQGVARQSYLLGMNYKNNKGYGVYLNGYYKRWSSSPSLQANDRKFILDAKLTKEWANVFRHMDMEVFFNIHNVTNSKYWSSINFPLPERHLEGGLTIKF